MAGIHENWVDRREQKKELLELAAGNIRNFSELFSFEESQTQKGIAKSLLRKIYLHAVETSLQNVFTGADAFNETISAGLGVNWLEVALLRARGGVNTPSALEIALAVWDLHTAEKNFKN